MISLTCFAVHAARADPRAAGGCPRPERWKDPFVPSGGRPLAPGRRMSSAPGGVCPRPTERLGPRLRLCARAGRICWRGVAGRCTKARVCFGLCARGGRLGRRFVVGPCTRWELCVRVRGGRSLRPERRTDAFARAVDGPHCPSGGRIPHPERWTNPFLPSGGRPLAPGAYSLAPGRRMSSAYRASRAASSPLCTGMAGSVGGELAGRCTKARVCFAFVHVVVGLAGVSWSGRAQRWELRVRARGGRIPSLRPADGPPLPERWTDPRAPSGGRIRSSRAVDGGRCFLGPGRRMFLGPGRCMSSAYRASRAASSPLCTGWPDLLEGSGWPVHKGAGLLRLCARGGRLGRRFVVRPCTKVGAACTSARWADPRAPSGGRIPSPERWTDSFARASGRIPSPDEAWLDGVQRRGTASTLCRSSSDPVGICGSSVHKVRPSLRLCARAGRTCWRGVAGRCTKARDRFGSVHVVVGLGGVSWSGRAQRRGTALLCARGRQIERGSVALPCTKCGRTSPLGMGQRQLHGPAGSGRRERLAGAQKQQGADLIVMRRSRS